MTLRKRMVGWLEQSHGPVGAQADPKAICPLAVSDDDCRFFAAAAQAVDSKYLDLAQNKRQIIDLGESDLDRPR